MVVGPERWENARHYHRKVQMLELFTRFRELRPEDYWRLSGGWKRKQDAWTYLRRHKTNGLLRRSRDWRGRLVYSIARNGARYLLWWKSQFPDERVTI